MQHSTVSEIHAYPVKPPGFQEVLFPSSVSKREVAEHLLEAPWLRRASEIRRGSGETVHALEETVELTKAHSWIEVFRSGSHRRCSWRRRRIERVIDRWREVGRWWEEDGRAERTVFRVSLSGGAVVDLCRDGSGEWFLAGIVD